MRCAICDYDEETGPNENVDAFAYDRPRRRVTKDKQSGEYYCSVCNAVNNDIANDWYQHDAAEDWLRLNDKKTPESRAIEQAGKHRKGVDKDLISMYSKSEDGDTPFEDAEIEALLDEYECQYEEPGEPGDLEDTMPELQDAGERHK